MTLYVFATHLSEVAPTRNQCCGGAAPPPQIFMDSSFPLQNRTPTAGSKSQNALIDSAFLEPSCKYFHNTPALYNMISSNVCMIVKYV